MILFSRALEGAYLSEFSEKWTSCLKKKKRKLIDRNGVREIINKPFFIEFPSQ